MNLVPQDRRKFSTKFLDGNGDDRSDLNMDLKNKIVVAMMLIISVFVVLNKISKQRAKKSQKFFFQIRFEYANISGY